MAFSTALLAGALLGGCGQQQQAATNELAGSADNGADQQPSRSDTTPTNEHEDSRITGPDGEADPAANRTESNSTPGESVPETDDAHTGRPESDSTAGRPESRRCHTSMLAASLEPGHPGAGQRYAELTLRNTAGRTCTVYGYPGLEFTGANGTALPTDVEWSADPGPSKVRLAPDESTTTTLHWGVVPTGTASTGDDCEPLPSALRVTPPDETDVLRLRWDLGRVCDNGHVSATAFH
ncbi:DUF4232 domain-containing protein [Actinopolyspora erythraea]|uniref:DUF4232 domain-containing protein n=1 Tax=Actinopolyspora erythraea TaxID=414996 RepID=UPI0012FE49F1|nr:DUF4232 domain-containing protein [Actinopolyspora erythraea]